MDNLSLWEHSHGCGTNSSNDRPTIHTTGAGFSQMRVPLPVRDATEQVWQSLSKARFVIALVAVAVVNAGPASSCADELLVTISSSEGAAANMVRYNTLLAVEQPGSCSGRIELCRPLPQVRVFLHQDAPIGSLVAAAPLDESQRSPRRRSAAAQLLSPGAQARRPPTSLATRGAQRQPALLPRHRLRTSRHRC